MIAGLQTWGTEGDVRPFLALAAELVKHGHSASVSVTEIMNGDYSSYGNDFGFNVIHPGKINVSRDEFTSLGKQFVSSRNPALKSRLLVENFLNPSLDAMFETAMDICRKSDFVIGHIFAYSLRAAAMITKTPWIALYTTPIISSDSVAAPGFPDFLHRLGWSVFSRALDLLWKPDIDKFFNKKGLPVPGSVFQGVFKSEYLNLVAVSPSLYPGGEIHGYKFCGAMNTPGVGAGNLPEELEYFLERGDPPVFVTFGSMLHGEKKVSDVMGIVLQAVKDTGCRAIIQSKGPGGLENVLFSGRIPHRLVFPRCSMVVHHGGCGTSHTACRAGVPSVVVEYTSDQPMWGMILKKAGVAPEVLHRRSLTSSKLAEVLKRVLGEPAFKEKAVAIAGEMNHENGAGMAVKLIQEKFGG